VQGSTDKRLARVLEYALLAISGLYVLAYMAVAVRRMGYPFEVEWVEGGSLDQIRRLAAGQGLYVRPSPNYVPFVYAPLYYYLSAAAAKVIGVSFAPLRLVSFLASLGSLAVICLLVRRETGSWKAGALSAGLFAATYGLAGASFDMARVDMWFTFAALLVVYAVRWANTWWSYGGAGLLLAVALLSKQTALGTSAPLALYALYKSRRYGALLVLGAVVPVVIVSLILDHSSGGWYSYFVFRLPQQHGLNHSLLFSIWRSELLAPLPVACVLGGLFVLGVLSSLGRERWLFYALASACMIGGGYLARAALGSGKNAWLPAYAMLAILFGLGMHQALGLVRTALPDKRAALEVCFLALGLAQFLILAYNPASRVPGPRDWAAGQALVERIRQMPGEVLIPFHGYLASLAGKGSSPQWVGLGELYGAFGGHETPEGSALREEFRQAIREQRYSAILLDRNWWLCQEEIDRYYVRRGPVFAPGEQPLWTVPGERLWPNWIYVPREPAR